MEPPAPASAPLDISAPVDRLLDILEATPSTVFLLSQDERRTLWARLYGASLAVKIRALDFICLLKAEVADRPKETVVDLWKIRFGSTYKVANAGQKDRLLQCFLALLSSATTPTWSISELLGPEPFDADALHFLEQAKRVVRIKPLREQEFFLALADPAVVDNLLSAAEHIAREARFTRSQKKEVRVLLLGQAGVGKSCLINEMLRTKKCSEAVGGATHTTEFHEVSATYVRKAVPDERELDVNADLSIEITLIDSQGLSRETSADANNNFYAKMSNYVVEHLYGSGPIHVLCWLISGVETRLPPLDELWIRHFAKYLPVILVRTRSDKPAIHAAFLSWLNDRAEVPKPIPFFAITEVYARPETSRNGVSDAFGLAALGKAIASAFNQGLTAELVRSIQERKGEDLSTRRKRCYKIVAAATVVSAALGAAPTVPLMDTCGLIIINLGMIEEINRSYGLPLPVNVYHSTVKTLLGGGFNAALFIGCDFALDFLKLVPAAGVIATFISGGMAGGLTAAVGLTIVNAMERLVAESPSLVGIDPRRVEKVVFEEARAQARKSSNEVMREIQRLAA